jgi:hypothetical protein
VEDDVGEVGEGAVDDAGLDAGLLDGLHELVGQGEVVGEPGADGAYLLVDVHGEKAGDPPTAEAGEVADDIGADLLEELCSLVNLEEVNLGEAEVGVVSHVVGYVERFLDLVCALGLVDVCADDLDVGESGCDDVEHVVAHAAGGAYDEYGVHGCVWGRCLFRGCGVSS